MESSYQVYVAVFINHLYLSWRRRYYYEKRRANIETQRHNSILHNRVLSKYLIAVKIFARNAIAPLLALSYFLEVVDSAINHHENLGKAALRNS
jgi:hypothetical protein